MENLIWILGAIVAVVVGAVGGFFARGKVAAAAQESGVESLAALRENLAAAEETAREKTETAQKALETVARAEEKTAAEKARAAEIEARETAGREKIAALQKSESAEKARAAGLQAELSQVSKQRMDEKSASERSIAEQKKSMETAIEKQSKNFETLLQSRLQAMAAEMLEKNSRAFGEKSRKELEVVLSPLNRGLEEFRKQMDGVRAQSAAAHGELKNQIEGVRDGAAHLSEDAKNLTDALRGNRKVQGNWGEVILERALENAGLQKGPGYQTEVTMKGDDADAPRLGRADAVVFMPHNRHFIIDAKVSLSAYAEYQEREDGASRTEALRRHCDAVRDRIDELAARDYSALDLKGKDGSRAYSPKFVFMFMPIEPAFIAALSRDSGLIEYAQKKDVMITGPSTLYPILRTVENLWRIEGNDKWASDVVSDMEGIQKKFAAFRADMEKIKRGLDSAQNTYDDAIKKLATGKGNLIDKMKKLSDRRRPIDDDDDAPPIFEAVVESEEEESPREEEDESPREEEESPPAA